MSWNKITSASNQLSVSFRGLSILKNLLWTVTLFFVVFSTNYALAQWMYKDGEDPFEDTSYQIAMTPAEDGFSLAIKCENGTLFALARPRLLFHTEYTIPTKYRFDKEEPVDASWFWLKNIAVLRGNEAASFARSIVKHKKLVIKISDDTPNTISLKGASTHVTKVLTACKFDSK